VQILVGERQQDLEPVRFEGRRLRMSMPGHTFVSLDIYTGQKV
jgi:hypothetical protein